MLYAKCTMYASKYDYINDTIQLVSELFTQLELPLSNELFLI